MATTAPLTAMLQNFEDFITTCTPAQISQLNDAIKSVQTKDAGTSTFKAATSMTTKAGITTSKISKKSQGKKAKKMVGATAAAGVVAIGPKRPLNSWMAFRKYYLASLAPNTQKAISKVLTAWWREDPFEAKWAMLAKAYSIVRGNRTKEDVPLDGFFDICVPVIGIVQPESYKQVMGWRLTEPRADDSEKVPQLTRVALPRVLSDFYTTTNLSVADLVMHCHKAGYPKSSSSVAPNTDVAGSLTMAVHPTVTGVSNTPATASSSEVAAESQSTGEVLQDIEYDAGDFTLGNASTAINNTGASYPYNTMFDPTSQFDISFGPTTQEEGAAWDAFDPVMAGTGNDMNDVDWTTYLIDDSAF